MAIRKKNEHRTAKVLYIEQGKTAKEIAELLGVTEKTVGEWVRKDNWKRERDARMASPANRITNIQNIIGDLSEQRLQFNRELQAAEKAGDTETVKELRANVSKIDDAVSKWNKTLETINKESKVSLTTYLYVMEDIFKHLNHYDPKLFVNTLDFQEAHIQYISNKL